jgi:hypothetical protein
MRRNTFLLLVLGLLVFSCENPLEDRVEDLEDQLAKQEQQQAFVDSLINGLSAQQVLMNSIIAAQQVYIDSLTTVQQGLIDTLGDQQVYIDSLNAIQQGLKVTLEVQQAYIDSLHVAQQELINMLIGSQPITETGDDYVRINNVQICWGSGLADNNGVLVTFPVSFAEIPIVIMIPIANEQLIGSVKNITTNTATFYLNIGSKRSFNYQAIGLWF